MSNVPCPIFTYPFPLTISYPHIYISIVLCPVFVPLSPQKSQVQIYNCPLGEGSCIKPNLHYSYALFPLYIPWVESSLSLVHFGPCLLSHSTPITLYICSAFHFSTNISFCPLTNDLTNTLDLITLLFAHGPVLPKQVLWLTTPSPGVKREIALCLGHATTVLNYTSNRTHHEQKFIGKNPLNLTIDLSPWLLVLACC